MNFNPTIYTDQKNIAQTTFINKTKHWISIIALDIFCSGSQWLHNLKITGNARFVEALIAPVALIDCGYSIWYWSHRYIDDRSMGRCLICKSRKS